MDQKNKKIELNQFEPISCFPKKATLFDFNDISFYTNICVSLDQEDAFFNKKCLKGEKSFLLTEIMEPPSFIAAVSDVITAVDDGFVTAVVVPEVKTEPASPQTAVLKTVSPKGNGIAKVKSIKIVGTLIFSIKLFNSLK